MAKLPPEKLPIEYDQEVMQRLMEDVYKNFESANRDNIRDAITAFNRMQELDRRLTTVESTGSQATASSMSPLPAPTGVRCLKIGNLVVAWCHPIEIFKYPEVKGFQWFGSIDENFTPLIESAIVTITGAHTAQAGDASWVLRGNYESGTWLTSRYKQMSFYSDMSLNSSSAGITNLTTGETATLSTSCWDSTNPTIICANVTSGWNDQDKYTFDIWMPRNQIGMGMLPACVYMLPIGYHLDNPRWTGSDYTVKVRTFGNGKYSDFASSALDADTISTPTNLTVSEITKANGMPYYYLFGKPYVDILITWDPVADADDYIVKVTELN